MGGSAEAAIQNLLTRFPNLDDALVRETFAACAGHAGHAARALRALPAGVAAELGRPFEGDRPQPLAGDTCRSRSWRLRDLEERRGAALLGRSFGGWRHLRTKEGYVMVELLSLDGSQVCSPRRWPRTCRYEELRGTIARCVGASPGEITLVLRDAKLVDPASQPLCEEEAGTTVVMTMFRIDLEQKAAEFYQRKLQARGQRTGLAGLVGRAQESAAGA